MATVRESGGDYSSLNAAFAAAETDIDIDQAWDDDDTAACTCSTNGTNVTVSGGALHSGTFANKGTSDTGHYRLCVSGDHCIEVTGSLDITGASIAQCGTGASDEGIRFANSQSNAVRRCILAGERGAADQDAIYCFQSHLPTVLVENCVIYDWTRGGINYQNFSSGATGTATFNVVGTTIYDCGASGETEGGCVVAFESAGGTAVITLNINLKGCLIGGDSGSSTNLKDASVADLTVNWNIHDTIVEDGTHSQDASASNCTTATIVQGNPAATQVGVTTIGTAGAVTGWDLSLFDDADNVALDYGVVDDADPVAVPADDIVGTARPSGGSDTSIDAGAYELDQGGGGGGDPEGPLVGGKLVGGGILMKGRLV